MSTYWFIDPNPASIDYSAYEYVNTMLYNLMDLTWFMWNYGNAFLIPFGFYCTYHAARLFYFVMKYGLGTDLIGWLYNNSF